MLRLALHWQILIGMTFGAVVGLALNFTAGVHETSREELIKVTAGELHPYGMANPVHVSEGTAWFRDEPGQVQMQITEIKAGEVKSVRRMFVGLLESEQAPSGESRLSQLKNWPPPPAGFKNKIEEVSVNSLGELKEKDPAAYALFLLHGRSTARTAGDRLKMIGDLFLRMLKMVSVPLIIFSLLSGVMGLGHANRLGKMFGRTLLYYLATSMLAISTGLLMFNLIQPGKQAPPSGAEAGDVQTQQEDAAPKKGKDIYTVLFEQVEALIPTNPAQAIAGGKFLSIIAFSLAFGIFAILVGGGTAEFVGRAANAGFEVMMKMTMAIIKLAPIGVMCLMLYATATQGIGVFGRLGIYMLTVACALVFHAFVILPLILKFVARRSPWEFAKAMSPALFTAFSSASSNATLPLTLSSVEQRAGVSNRISSFVLPLGATINMDGTALYEVVAVLFIANLTPGFELTFYHQVIIAFTALLASVGAAGIPHAGLVMMVIVLQAVGLPTEQQGLIIAVDRILDMCRTSVNVWSDSCGCAVIARFEGVGKGSDASASPVDEEKVGDVIIDPASG